MIDILINCLFFIKEGKGTTELQKQYADTVVKYTAAKMLMGRGKVQSAIWLAEKALKNVKNTTLTI